MELGCHSKKSGNVQTGDRDNANSVRVWRLSWRQTQLSLAISYHYVILLFIKLYASFLWPMVELKHD